MYVEGVESYFDFQAFRHGLTYIALDGMVRKLSKTFLDWKLVEN